LTVGTLAQVDLLKYAPGGKYEIHTDHGTTTNRTLSVIINLNDEYEGGDLVFYHPNSKDESKRVKAKTGKIIFFPSNFLYPHCIEPVKKGTRYSIVSWLL
jgi:predicted 2-oxoglutarate/Fe(II)-dependent dioxygenase YbiX